mmetsp:Transcript_48780/g.154556  ORF Transcript_48780/g.154556 Transcript_48780/m.154556 type:complete len:155 (-) Transcript_48780:149-613(-)
MRSLQGLPTALAQPTAEVAYHHRLPPAAVDLKGGGGGAKPSALTPRTRPPTPSPPEVEKPPLEEAPPPAPRPQQSRPLPAPGPPRKRRLAAATTLVSKVELIREELQLLPREPEASISALLREAHLVLCMQPVGGLVTQAGAVLAYLFGEGDGE